MSVTRTFEVNTLICTEDWNTALDFDMDTNRFKKEIIQMHPQLSTVLVKTVMAKRRLGRTMHGVNYF